MGGFMYLSLADELAPHPREWAGWSAIHMPRADTTALPLLQGELPPMEHYVSAHYDPETTGALGWLADWLAGLTSTLPACEATQ